MSHPVTSARIPPEIKALIAALKLQEQNTELLCALTESQWHTLLEFCDLSHLTLALAQLPLDPFPAWVAERLRCNLADNALRYEAIGSAYTEAAAALERAGVEHIVIKGFTQAPGYVASPQLRAQSDLDLYCPPQQIGRAREALEESGYRSEKSNIAADHEHTLVRLGDWRWRGNHYDPEMPVGIELHFCLWNQETSRIAIPEVESFWNRRTVRQIDGLFFPCLNPIDHLGHLSLHILRNLLLRDWIIHHVRELAVFLHTHAEDDVFWARWSKLHPPSLRSLEAIAFYHARAWFQCRLHPHAEQAISELPRSRIAWLKRFSGSSLENMFAQNKDELWLHLSLLSSYRDRWKVLKHTLVPPRIAAPGKPIVGIRNKRSVQSNAAPQWQYLSYLISRSLSHGSASLSALFRGLSWWFSRYRLSAR